MCVSVRTSLVRSAVLAPYVLISIGLASTPASAGRAMSDLTRVSANPQAGNRLPLETPFWDEAGNSRTLGEAIGGVPAVVTFVDYECKNMCSAILALTANALANLTLTPGLDFRFVAIGLDPEVRVRVALELKSVIIDPNSPLSSQARFLTGDASSIERTAAAVGYRYSKDVENHQFAHAAALMTVSSNGVVTRVFNATNVTSEMLRDALVEARHAQGRSISAFEPVRLLCYGLESLHGLYTREIWIALRAGATLILVAMVAGALLLVRRRARA